MCESMGTTGSCGCRCWENLLRSSCKYMTEENQWHINSSRSIWVTVLTYRITKKIESGTPWNKSNNGTWVITKTVPWTALCFFSPFFCLADSWGSGRVCSEQGSMLVWKDAVEFSVILSIRKIDGSESLEGKQMKTLKISEQVVFYILRNMQQNRQQVSLCLENDSWKLQVKT